MKKRIRKINKTATTVNLAKILTNEYDGEFAYTDDRLFNLNIYVDGG